jgi:hypothetical protein
MSKAYWRIIQDEIEDVGWTVERAVKPQPGGGLHHIVTARKGQQRCMVTADSELAAMVQMKKEIGGIE